MPHGSVTPRTAPILAAEAGHLDVVNLLLKRDVDALHAEDERRGAIIRQKPTNFPWGLKEMNVEDLDGHRLRMAARLPDLPTPWR